MCLNNPRTSGNLARGTASPASRFSPTPFVTVFPRAASSFAKGVQNQGKVERHSGGGGRGQSSAADEVKGVRLTSRWQVRPRKLQLQADVRAGLRSSHWTDRLKMNWVDPIRTLSPSTRTCLRTETWLTTVPKVLRAS